MSESLNAIISKCVFIDSRAFPSDLEKRDEFSEFARIYIDFLNVSVLSVYCRLYTTPYHK